MKKLSLILWCSISFSGFAEEEKIQSQNIEVKVSFNAASILKLENAEVKDLGPAIKDKGRKVEFSYSVQFQTGICYDRLGVMTTPTSDYSELSKAAGKKGDSLQFANEVNFHTITDLKDETIKMGEICPSSARTHNKKVKMIFSTFSTDTKKSLWILRFPISKESFPRKNEPLDLYIRYLGDDQWTIDTQ